MKRKVPTKAQQRALLTLHQRNQFKYPSYLSFRRKAFWAFQDECLMVPWAGMIVDIELDGHTHS